jgi:hypothetical protein
VTSQKGKSAGQHRTANYIVYYTSACISWSAGDFSIYVHGVNGRTHYRNRRTHYRNRRLAECLKNNTRQRLCRVSHSAKKTRHIVYQQSLFCRVLFLALNKEKQSLRRRVTETASLSSVPGDTRQRSYLCRVSDWQHWAKNPLEGSTCQVLC